MVTPPPDPSPPSPPQQRAVDWPPVELNVYLASRDQQVDQEAAPTEEFDYNPLTPTTPIAPTTEEFAPLSPATPLSPTLAPTDTVASKHGAMPTPPPPPANPEAEGSM